MARLYLPSGQLTIRMTEPGSTLNGYIFSDNEHAKAWLSQKFVQEDPSKYRLERVRVVKESCRCKKCDGSGWSRPQIETLEKLTVDEFLKKDSP